MGILKISFILSLLVFLAGFPLAAVEGGPTRETGRAAVDTNSPTPRRYTDAQLSRVVGWVRERAPTCPPEAMIVAAEHFLEELSRRYPEELEQISTDGYSLRRFESMLLRHMAGSLSGSQYTSLREDLARQRIETTLAAEGSTLAGPPLSSAELIGKIKGSSQVQHRRLVDGRMEDDDLVLLLKRIHSGGAPAGPTKPQQPKTLSAADIVSEFRRQNQSGSALRRLHAYSIDATLKTATGETQRLVLSRLLPDRFRLVVKSADTTQLILASNGRRFWQQSANRKPGELSRAAMGTKIYLGEFINPLFSEEGYTFEKLDEGVFDGSKVHRLRVRRADGSDYISCIDVEKFREIGREKGGESTVSYSDFREVAGITFAFRENVKDEQGRSAVFEIQRIVPNPGVVQSYFEPPDLTEPNFFAIEQWMAEPVGTAANIR